MSGQLSVLTSYSLLQSTNRIPDLVRDAKQKGYTALAITDINVMHGVIEFYQECIKQNIKPIIGVTLQYQSKYYDNKQFEVCVYAKNKQGYNNLLKISSLRNDLQREISFYLADVQHLFTDVILCFPWETSELRYLISQQESTYVNDFIKSINSTVKADDWFQGLAYYSAEENERLNYIEYFNQLSVKLIAMKQVSYLKSDDAFSVNTLKAIESGIKLSAEDFVVRTGSNWLPDYSMFIKEYIDNQQSSAIQNLEQMINEICLDIPLHQTLLPAFPLPQGIPSYQYLRDLCDKGLRRINKQDNAAYQKRLNMELSVIHEMGYDDYFLIVWDVMKYAREHDIVTACRGSAAGSLVSYVLQITNVDPIQYQLLFERFLNKERYTMPDIDMDIPDNRREEVLHYVYMKYGHNRVAQIATFGTLAAKMALRDVSRVFGLSQSEATQWANAVPNVLKITLGDSLNTSKKLQQLVDFSERNQLLFKTACQIEGLPRHVSTHAAGVVISDQDLTNLVPLQNGNNDIPLTQFAMGEIETIGLLKMDFLGLRNLAIIGNTLDSIDYLTGNRLYLNEIPMNDEATLQLFQKGKTVGVFQFESAGIKNVLKKLHPTSIEDIASVNALYRPGPMQFIDQFIARKKGEEPIAYPDDSLKEILEKTYGIIVYQEQIMQIASKLAGFTLGQADILRRAISKKKKDILDQEREHFVQGALNQGHSKNTANEVYNYIEHFANYGFNRSHAVVYSVLAYQMGYLKVHYSVPFFAALLHSVRNNPEKIKEYLAESKEFGVKTVIPGINKSDFSFKLQKGKIIFGFSSIKGVRKDLIKHILELRKADGPFSSLENFLIRLNGKWLKEENILPLIYSGAFDELHGNRRQLVIDIGGLIRNIEYSGGSMDLLGVLSLKTENVTDFSPEEKLQQEVDYLGTYVSGHPIDTFKELSQQLKVKKIVDIVPGEQVRLLGFVQTVKKIRTKKGESMAFLSVTDNTGEIEVTIFPKLFRQLHMNVEQDSVVYLTGKVELSQYSKQNQLIVNTFDYALDKQNQLSQKKCYIKIEQINDSNVRLNQLKDIFSQFSGSTPVVLVFMNQGKNLLLEKQYWIDPTEQFIQILEDILGKKTIIIK
ncbi:DNA polymerase III subunit alpha [Vagococcus vulneris]|uniref:DNA polymerase III subunit alpha n=1 Tax=Vagococcus vulneris TaxID=1977869 RepID=A0A429ZZ40_9ENTE|nr:DNA polymerase III subunit alpha [Vagococcus vulneris]RST99264.1 DNA polymerase III subunit alpha [Vagococcus vulneris]